MQQQTQKCLENPEKFFQELDLENKEKIKALSFQVSQEEITEKTLQEILKKVNIELYKKQVTQLKNLMKEGDQNAFVEYSELIKIAKQQGLK